jgi:glyoxylase-like metal-dependent hydrolase (beta-lactamase superfamily II)
MIFRQLFESSSSTYTYLIACKEKGEVALIDPVLETVDRDLEIIRQLGLTLTYTIDTHIHADHLTSATKLKALTDCKIVYPKQTDLPCADLYAEEGKVFKIGSIALHPLFTPGHTDHHYAYLIDQGVQQRVFTGDALLIDACGRTDFQSGDAGQLFDSIQNKLFSLPGETLVYPAHDYSGRHVSSIAQEMSRNPRLGNEMPKDEFIKIMDGLDLPYPKKIDFAVPGNESCGVCPPNVPDYLRSPCEVSDQG